MLLANPRYDFHFHRIDATSPCRRKAFPGSRGAIDEAGGGDSLQKSVGRRTTVGAMTGNIPGDPERGHVITAALFAPFLLVLALLAYSLDAERSRRDVERMVLHDYSGLAVAELARITTDALHQQVSTALAAP